MRRVSAWAIAALVLALPLTTVSVAKALRVAVNEDMPAQQQAMTAEVVVVGKVIEIEKEMAKASPAPGVADKVEYKVAVVKIEDALLGAKGITTIRVGYQNIAAAAPEVPLQNGNGNLKPMFRNLREPLIAPLVALNEGQEAAFFLKKHHDGDFYVMQQFARPLNKTTANYDKTMAQVKKTLKIYEDPKAALQSKETADRSLAACTLVQKYRSYPQMTAPRGKVVTEPIDAEESKLILAALSEMKWGQPDANGMNLQAIFFQLGVQPKDGWTQPKALKGQDYNKMLGDAVTKWLADNNEKYRINRNVVK